MRGEGETIMSAGDWKRAVLERDGRVCTTCGSDETDVYFLTPRSLGGRTTVSNGISLCMRCRLDHSAGGLELSKIRYNIPLPKDFIRDLNLLSMAVGRSVSDIIREVMAEAVFTNKWASLTKVGTNGCGSDRANFWVSKPVAEKFEAWCKTREMTVHTAVRSLLWAWTQEIQKGV